MKKKVVLFGRHRVNLSLMAKVLEEAGYVCRIVDNPAHDDVLSADLLIYDGDILTIEALANLPSAFKEKKSIFFISQCSNSLITAYRAAGIDLIFTKPVSKEDLLGSVAGLMGESGGY